MRNRRRFSERNVSDEPITSAGHRLDRNARLSTAPERFSKAVNALREIALLDGGVRPYGLHQIGFVNDVAVTIEQSEQNCDGFGRKRKRLAVAHDDPLIRIDEEGAESV